MSKQGFQQKIIKNDKEQKKQTKAPKSAQQKGLLLAALLQKAVQNKKKQPTIITTDQQQSQKQKVTEINRILIKEGRSRNVIKEEVQQQMNEQKNGIIRFTNQNNSDDSLSLIEHSLTVTLQGDQVRQMLRCIYMEVFGEEKYMMDYRRYEDIQKDPLGYEMGSIGEFNKQGKMLENIVNEIRVMKFQQFKSRKEIKQLNKQLDMTYMKAQKQQVQTAELQQKLSDMSQEVNRLKAQLQKNNKNQNNENNINNDDDNQFRILENGNKKLKQKNRMIEGQRGQHNQERELVICTLQSENMHLSQSLNVLQQQYDQLQFEFTRLEEEMQEMKMHCQKQQTMCQQKINLLNSVIAQRQSQIQDLLNTITDLEIELSHSKQLNLSNTQNYHNTENNDNANIHYQQELLIKAQDSQVKDIQVEAQQNTILNQLNNIDQLKTIINNHQILIKRHEDTLRKNNILIKNHQYQKHKYQSFIQSLLKQIQTLQSKINHNNQNTTTNLSLIKHNQKVQISHILNLTKELSKSYDEIVKVSQKNKTMKDKRDPQEIN